jgi:hypothetical protein
MENNILIYYDNLNYINNNIKILLLLLIILSIYYINNNNNINIENIINLFDNQIFKFIIFIIISYISSSNPIIGISLAIFLLINLQLITYTKFKKELDEDIKDITI